MVDQIGQEGGQAEFVRADVAEVDEVRNLISAAIDTYGRLDFAHNNAGIEGTGGPLHEYPEDVWDQVLRVNLTSVFLCLKYEITAMLEHRRGAIVNTASVAGLTGARLGAYTVSKHGVVGLTRLAAREYADEFQRLRNRLSPGNPVRDLG